MFFASTNFYQQIFGTSRSSQIINAVILFVILYAACIFIVLPLARLVLDALDYRRHRSTKMISLELTPPSISSKTVLATSQWYNAIHGLLSSVPTRARLLRRKNVLPLEIVATRREGIRFIARVDPNDVELFQQLLLSYLPDIRVREVQDYIPENLANHSYQILEFKQIGNFSFPLASQDKLNQHDPIAYITGSMTRLLPNETMAMQLILSPAPRRTANKVRAQLLHGQDATVHRKWWHYPFIAIGKIIKLIFTIFGTLLETIGDEMSGVRSRPPEYSFSGPHKKTLNPNTEHVIGSIHDKLDQPLFNVDIRALIISDDGGQRAQGFVNSLYLFHVPGYQALSLRRSFPRGKMTQYRLNSFRLRLPAMLTRNSCVLSSSEVASLFHFPYTQTGQAENVIKSLSKTLPSPVSMKVNADTDNFDVMLGVNRHHGSMTPIGLTATDREKHVYVIGGTGNGKTTLLEGAIVQDIIGGKGVAFIDPHGDAAQKLLGYIPESRLNDVIYLNPVDIKYPVGINLLELPEGLDEDELLLEKERVTEAVVSIFRKVFADDEANAHRIETMLRNGIQTAFTVKDATIFTVLKLFRNTDFRKEVINKLEDADLKDFWREEFGQAGNMQRVSMTKGITQRLNRFLSSAPVYRMLSQTKSTISFEDIINSGKIFICNFSQDMGEDTSALLGTTILAKLKIAAEQRAKISEDERKPFYVYVDEFQNFATMPFVKMLASSRKYKLFLTIAEQSTAQQEEHRLTEAILANVSTVVCFRTGSPADERLLLPRFEPFLEKGEIGNLPAYNFYVRLQAKDSLEPFSGETVVLSKNDYSSDVAKSVVDASRKNYGVDYKEYQKVTKPSPNNTSAQTKVNNAKKPIINRRAVRHTKG